MLFLTVATDVFNLITAAALSCDWTASWVDLSTANGAVAGSAQGNVVAIATTPVVGSPPDTITQRQLKTFTIVNKDASASQTVTFEKTTSGGSFAYGGARNIILGPNESLIYIDSIGWVTKDTNGLTKAPVTANVTVLQQPALPWITSFAPVVSASGGTITTASATMVYQHDPVNLKVTFTANIQIASNGTGSGSLLFTLPFAPNGSEVWVFSGRENALTGKMVQGLAVSGSPASLEFYDNTYPGSSGCSIFVSGTYHSSV